MHETWGTKLALKPGHELWPAWPGDYDLTGSDFRCDEQNEYQSYSKFKVDKGVFMGVLGMRVSNTLGVSSRSHFWDSPR